jgi:hypothetical protein
MAKTLCGFCERPDKITREHIFGQWLKSLCRARPVRDVRLPPDRSELHAFNSARLIPARPLRPQLRNAPLTWTIIEARTTVRAPINPPSEEAVQVLSYGRASHSDDLIG